MTAQEFKPYARFCNNAKLFTDTVPSDFFMVKLSWLYSVFFETVLSLFFAWLQYAGRYDKKTGPALILGYSFILIPPLKTKPSVCVHISSKLGLSCDPFTTLLYLLCLVSVKFSKFIYREKCLKIFSVIKPNSL